MTNLKRLLTKLGACSEAVEWANGKELAEAWATCQRVDWMLWLVGKMEDRKGWPTRKQAVLLACLFAEDVLPMFEKKYPDDNRPRRAIEIARLWCAGKATLDEIRAAWDAARDAARAAAWAAARDATGAAARDATGAAAWDAAWAAARDAAWDAAGAAARDATGAAAWDAAWAAKMKEYADLTRRELKIPLEAKP